MKNPYHSQFKPTFPFMATDWRKCWTPKRLKVQLPTFTTGFVLPSIKIVYYQHLLVSFEELLSLRLSDHLALVVGCINNNWLNLCNDLPKKIVYTVIIDHEAIMRSQMKKIWQAAENVFGKRSKLIVAQQPVVGTWRKTTSYIGNLLQTR